MSREEAVRAAADALTVHYASGYYCRCGAEVNSVYEHMASRAVDAAAPHLTADLVRERDWWKATAERLALPEKYHARLAEAEQAIRERDEALAKVDHWKRMADRREQSLDALGAERNTWARQMADLNDERDDARREKADAEARMRDALNERDDALARAEAAEAEVERLRSGLVRRRVVVVECRYTPDGPWSVWSVYRDVPSLRANMARIGMTVPTRYGWRRYPWTWTDPEYGYEYRASQEWLRGDQP